MPREDDAADAFDPADQTEATGAGGGGGNVILEKTSVEKFCRKVFLVIFPHILKKFLIFFPFVSLQTHKRTSKFLSVKTVESGFGLAVIIFFFPTFERKNLPKKK